MTEPRRPDLRPLASLALLPLLACGEDGAPRSLDAAPNDAAVSTDSGVDCPAPDEAAELMFIAQTLLGGVPLESGQRMFVGSNRQPSTLLVQNLGTSTATVGPVRLETGLHFWAAWASGEDIAETLQLAPGAERPLLLGFSVPSDDSPRSDALSIHRRTSSCEPALWLRLQDPRAGPRLEIAPPTLQLPNPGPACAPLTLKNTGALELRIHRFEIEATTTPGSADDFSIRRPECEAGQPDCTLDLRVPGDGEVTVDVCYANNDESDGDGARLWVHSNDESALDGVRPVGLRVRHSHCFGPSVSARVSGPACMSRTATIDLSQTASNPGGYLGTGGRLMECTLEVQFGEPFDFEPNPVTSWDDGWRTEFVPDAPGPRVIGISCLNNCGKTGRGQVAFEVEPCP